MLKQVGQVGGESEKEKKMSDSDDEELDKETLGRKVKKHDLLSFILFKTYPGCR